jgi:hypothetical protein
VAQPVYHEGAWWHQQPDGTWLRWNDQTQAWEPLPSRPESPGALQPAWAPGVPYRNSGIARAVVVVLCIGIATDLLSIVSGAFEINLYNRLIDGEDVTESEIDADDARVVIASILQFTIYTVSAVLFLIWFYRAYANVRALGVPKLRYGVGWSIGAWFVPILNLWRPKQIANDVWRGSDPDLPAPAPDDWTERPVPGLLGWWWAAWLLNPVLYAVANIYYGEADLELQRTGAVIYMMSDVFSVLAAALLIVIVRRATERQEERAARLRGVGPAVPAGTGGFGR